MSGNRFGRLQAGETGVTENEIFQNVGNVSFITAPGAGGSFGHSYFRDDPAVLSDLVLLVRTNARPGSSTRPLAYLGGNFWEIPRDYPGNAVR